MEGRLNKAELSVEIDNLRAELEKAKESTKESAREEVEAEKVEAKQEEVPASVIEEAPGELQAMKTEPVKETDQGLKKKMFELKTKVDTLQSKIDNYAEENAKLLQDNDKYLTEIQKKNSRIKQLELVCSELEEEKTHVNMQLKNIGFIQRQDEVIKPRLSTCYMNITAPRDPADPFAPAKKQLSKFKDAPASVIHTALGSIKESSEASLATQMGIDESGFASTAAIDKIFSKSGESGVSVGQTADGAFDLAAEVKKAEGVPSNARIRGSNLFETGDYFKSKAKQELNMIDEDEEERLSNPLMQERNEQMQAIEEIRSGSGEEIKDLPGGKGAIIRGVAGSAGVADAAAGYSKGAELSIGDSSSISAGEVPKNISSAGVQDKESKTIGGISAAAMDSDLNIPGASITKEAQYTKHIGEIGIGANNEAEGKTIEKRTTESQSIEASATDETTIKKKTAEKATKESMAEVQTEEEKALEQRILQEGKAEEKTKEQANEGEMAEEQRAKEETTEERTFEAATEESKATAMTGINTGRISSGRTFACGGQDVNIGCNPKTSERQEIGIGDEGAREEQKHKNVFGIGGTTEISQVGAGSGLKKSELSVGEGGVISMEGPERVNRPGLSVGAVGYMSAEPGSKKVPLSIGGTSDISGEKIGRPGESVAVGAGEEPGSKAISKPSNEISTGEGFSIQGTTKNEAGKGEPVRKEARSSEEVAIGTDKEQETKKAAADKARLDATKAVQEKLANKIKEQKKKVEAALGATALDIRPSKITTFDFLTLKKNPKITKIVASLKEANSAIIFSDYVYVIREDNMSHKSKRILYITEYSIFVMHHKTFQIQRVTPITDLRMVILVKTSGSLVAFHFEKA
eukprot:TRINITY_DN3267_c0_g1_i4.p1 TRINITY_DN3267_c0_g1~~TRINITY_DN3267_c0_g1_i4.p1  ORF type:complete len:866 (-),score=271.76 TRINITY_DN3267_c0_g1_i4:74-2671(-)